MLPTGIMLCSLPIGGVITSLQSLTGSAVSKHVFPQAHRSTTAKVSLIVFDACFDARRTLHRRQLAITVAERL